MNRPHRDQEDDSSNNKYRPREAIPTPLEELLSNILSTSDLSRLTLVDDNARPPPITAATAPAAMGKTTDEHDYPISHSDHLRRIMMAMSSRPVSDDDRSAVGRSSSDGMKQYRRQWGGPKYPFNPSQHHDMKKLSKAETRWTPESRPSYSPAYPSASASLSATRSIHRLGKSKGQGNNLSSPDHLSSSRMTVMQDEDRRRHRRSWGEETINHQKQLATPRRTLSPPPTSSQSEAQELSRGNTDREEHNDIINESSVINHNNSGGTILGKDTTEIKSQLSTSPRTDDDDDGDNDLHFLLTTTSPTRWGTPPPRCTRHGAMVRWENDIGDDMSSSGYHRRHSFGESLRTNNDDGGVSSSPLLSSSTTKSTTTPIAAAGTTTTIAPKPSSIRGRSALRRQYSDSVLVIPQRSPSTDSFLGEEEVEEGGRDIVIAK